MKNTKKKPAGSGTFRFNWKRLGARDVTTQRDVRRTARQLAAPPDRERRSYGRAKPLNSQQVQRVIAYLRHTSRVPESDVLKVYLSYYAGLRACEIARLRVIDVTDASGAVEKTYFRVPDSISKGGRGRLVPMHPLVSEAIKEFRRAYPGSERLAISSRRGRTQTPNAIVAWFWHLYRRLGYHGASSHSGRRWFITELARAANQHGCSLKDVQEIVGHSRLDSTNAYIDFTDNVRSLVNALSDDRSGPARRGSNSRGQQRRRAA